MSTVQARACIDRQQYVMLFAQKGVVLPLCALGWMYGVLPPELIYLLTGVYVMSDSMLNATPVRGGSWGGNYAVHAHHLFTMLLCAVGAHLPPRPVMGGALCIFVCVRCQGLRPLLPLPVPPVPPRGLSSACRPSPRAMRRFTSQPLADRRRLARCGSP